MATSEAGRLLTEAHRRRQLALRAATLSDIIGLWGGFRLDDIDSSWQPLEVGLLAVLSARWRQSAGISSNYYRALRTAEGASGPAEPRLADRPNPTLVVASLRLAGPIGAKKNIAANTPNPEERTLTRVSGTLTRLALLGGRQTLIASARADRSARGWRRVTDSSPCDWCADIARQDVIGLDVDFEAHDHCGCSAEPAFR